MVAACLVLPLALVGCSGQADNPTSAPPTAETPDHADPTEAFETPSSEKKELWIELPDDPRLIDDDEGEGDDGTRWVGYSAFDRTVLVAVMSSPLENPASDADIEKWISDSLRPVGSSWSIKPDAELTQKYGHTVRRFSFDVDGNAKQPFTGLYFDTDSGGLLVAAGFKEVTEEQRTAVEGWFNNLKFVEVEPS